MGRELAIFNEGDDKKLSVEIGAQKLPALVVAAGERSVRIQNGAGEPLDIPYDEVVRANLIDEG